MRILEGLEALQGLGLGQPDTLESRSVVSVGVFDGVTRAGQVFWGPRVEGGDGEGQGGLVVRKAQMHRLRQDKESLREKLSDLLRGKRGGRPRRRPEGAGA